MNRTNGLGTRLRHLSASLDADVQHFYQERDLPFRPRFFPIAQCLLRDGESSVSALAERTGVSQPAVTQTLGEMASLGLIVLSAGDDRRVRRVALTDKCRAIAKTLTPLWDAVEAAAADLDAELPHPLSGTIDAALEALQRKPFRERIKARMTND